jgi:hypothetical protein
LAFDLELWKSNVGVERLIRAFDATSNVERLGFFG